MKLFFSKIGNFDSEKIRIIDFYCGRGYCGS